MPDSGEIGGILLLIAETALARPGSFLMSFLICLSSSGSRRFSSASVSFTPVALMLCIMLLGFNSTQKKNPLLGGLIFFLEPWFDSLQSSIG
jgi:hypothetical protein